MYCGYDSKATNLGAQVICQLSFLSNSAKYVFRVTIPSGWQKLNLCPFGLLPPPLRGVISEFSLYKVYISLCGYMNYRVPKHGWW